jgi:hypothetical protein
MKHPVVNLMLLVWALTLFGCSGGDGASASGKGTVSLSLTDAPVDGLKAVYISIEEVRVCVQVVEIEAHDDLNPKEMEDGCIWEIIAEPRAVYNLLELVNGVTETLGVADLPAGTYHQMRLMIGPQLNDGAESVKGFNLFGEEHPYANYLIDGDGEAQNLKVPGGLQSGVKLVREFEINADAYTDLILDFDARRSIVKTGDKENYILKPFIRVLDTKDMVRLAGTVNNTEGTPLEAVAVSAQRREGSLGLIVEAATTTDESGGYQLLLEKNKEYTIVVFSSAHAPVCELINVFDADLRWEFLLEAAESRQVAGTIPGAPESSDVRLSIRKTGQACGDGDQDIELLSETIAPGENGYAYSVTLPVGEGYAAVYSYGENEAFTNFTVEAGQDPHTPQTVELAFDTTK